LPRRWGTEEPRVVRTAAGPSSPLSRPTAAEARAPPEVWTAATTAAAAGLHPGGGFSAPRRRSGVLLRGSGALWCWRRWFLLWWFGAGVACWTDHPVDGGCFAVAVLGRTRSTSQADRDQIWCWRFGPRVDAWSPFVWRMPCRRGTVETWSMRQFELGSHVEVWRLRPGGCLATVVFVEARSTSRSDRVSLLHSPLSSWSMCSSC
jgi:hypothetical protein